MKYPELLARLKSALTVDENEFTALKVFKESKNPFKVLIATIISQNTAESNAFKAYERLELSVGVTPSKLASTPTNIIEEAIRPAGLWRQKARAIKSLAVEVLNGLDLFSLYRDKEEARRVLTSIPGIGEKTVDVYLALFRGDVIPVDTHVRRVAKRLGLTSSSTYVRIRRDLEDFFPPDVRLQAHFYLILLGRRFCKAKSPDCGNCPLSYMCLSRRS